MNKKGVLGFDTVKAVILTLLMLAVLIIAVFAVLIPLRTSIESIDVQSGSVTNESISAFNEVTAGRLNAYNVYRNAACTVTQCVNTTGAPGVISTTNYTATASDCTIRYSGIGTSIYNNTGHVKCSYTYTYDSNGTNYLVETMTQGPSKFFANVPTFFTLLGVVVLILIIAIVIIAVMRFSGMGSGGGNAELGGGSYTGGSLENI